MGGELESLLAQLLIAQADGGAPPADAAAAADGAAVATDGAAAADAAAAAVDAAAPAADAAAPAADAAAPAADAASPLADAAAALADAGIKAFEVTAPVADAPAPVWVEYLVYAAIAALILFFVVRGMRSGPATPLETPDRPKPAPTTAGKTDEQLDKEVQKAFGVTEAVVPADGKGRIRLIRKAPPKEEPKPPAEKKAPDPTAKGPAKPAPSGKAAEAKAPPEKKKPTAEKAGKTLREGLSRTREGFVGRLGKLFGGAKTIDDDLLGDLEEALFTADIGVRTSQKLVDLVHEALGKKDLGSPDRVWQAVKDQIRDILQVDAPPLDFAAAKPFVIMVVGVNGAGKTTSIGKLARRLADEGKKVLLAAGDTFRAAAVEQLEVWGERAGAPVIKGESGQDPSSVIFEAIKTAERDGYDVLIADTAGRLQAKTELMDELAKVHRVSGKALDGAPHEVWLVLDSTNGQNAISQAKVFTDAVDVTGLVLTKLDGTAKGGVVIGISDEMRLPVRFIGIGEKVEDLRAFDPESFAEALLSDT